jgi:hypothetical protein
MAADDAVTGIPHRVRDGKSGRIGSFSVRVKESQV